MKIRNVLLGATFVAGLLSLAGAAQATTLYLGVQPGSAGAITNLANDSATPGTASYSAPLVSYGGLSIDGFSASEVPPPPNVNSNTVDVTAALSTGSSSLFVSEIGQTAVVPSFASLFAVAGFNLAAAGGTAISVTESTYATACAAATCTAADAFATGNLLSTQTFNSTGGAGSVTDYAASPNLGAGQYVTTLEYTIRWQTFNGADHGNITASIDLAQTPLPASLPLFVSGLGALGFLAHRRKKKFENASQDGYDSAIAA